MHRTDQRRRNTHRSPITSLATAVRGYAHGDRDGRVLREPDPSSAFRIACIPVADCGRLVAVSSTRLKL